MKDVGSAPKTGSADRDAVAQIAHRMRHDAEIAYLMGWGTESYQRVVSAQMAATGHCEADVEASLSCVDTRKPRWEKLELQVDRLERLLDKHVEGWRDGEEVA
ncbi:MAG: hypothetical protein JNK72_00215 [Myxococcales bacterium]|nr:hypothetical protein [Myxococcales bacterium]